MITKDMPYWRALIELESGGYADICDEHVMTLLVRTVEEMQRRGFRLSLVPDQIEEE